MIHGWGIALTGAMIAVAGAGLGYRQGDALRAERIVELKPSLDTWRRRLDADVRRIEYQRETVERWVDDAALELSRMQARIVHLESSARRVVQRTDLEDDAFDFDGEPGVGGPEDAAIEWRHEPDEWQRAAASLASQIDDRWLQLRILEDLLEWRELRAAVRPEGRPVRAVYVSSGFGPRIDPFSGRQAMHRGIDFAGRAGTEIVAVAAGIVTWSGTRAGYGKLVEIDHGNGLTTRYAHNSDNLVRAGEVVTRGQLIARLGATGRATGPNLHFEVLRDGEAVNPLPFID